MDDLIVVEALKKLRNQYVWWRNASLTTPTEREIAEEKITRIDRQLKEITK